MLVIILFLTSNSFKVLKLEQTKRHDDAPRIRDLEISLSQTFEDKKKIECLYIETSNSLKEAVQEISTLSRRYVIMLVNFQFV